MHQCGGRKEREIDYEVEIIIYVQSELGTMHSHSHEKENPSRENQFFFDQPSHIFKLGFGPLEEAYLTSTSITVV